MVRNFFLPRNLCRHFFSWPSVLHDFFFRCDSSAGNFFLNSSNPPPPLKDQMVHSLLCSFISRQLNSVTEINNRTTRSLAGTNWSKPVGSRNLVIRKNFTSLLQNPTEYLSIFLETRTVETYLKQRLRK